jgi:hypothetical protein
MTNNSLQCQFCVLLYCSPLPIFLYPPRTLPSSYHKKSRHAEQILSILKAPGLNFSPETAYSRVYPPDENCTFIFFHIHATCLPHILAQGCPTVSVKGPQPWLWTCSRAVQVNITISGTHNLPNCCAVFTIHTQFTNWPCTRRAGKTPMF